MVGDEVMTYRLVTTKADDSLMGAAQKMRDHEVGWLPVASDGAIVCVVTDRDIVIRAIAEGSDVNTTPIESAMSEEKVWCRISTPVEDAAQLMEENKIRRLLVRDEGDQPIGVVSLGDLALGTVGHDLAGEILEDVSNN
ncbi:MAG: CBS domain-containing protein [Planctomycetota bacterium]